jgi:hypothetical protein
MTFFGPRPPEPPEDPESRDTGWRPPRWDRPSEGTLGATVAITEILGRTDDLVVAIDHVTAYPNGFAFDLVFLATPLVRREGPMMHSMLQRRQVPRVGFEFSDGTRVTTGGGPFMGPFTELEKDDEGVPTKPVLMPRGGGGGGMGAWTMRHWLFGLPTPGDLKLYFEFEPSGIPETMTVLDADAIREAAARAVVIWG